MCWLKVVASCSFSNNHYHIRAQQKRCYFHFSTDISTFFKYLSHLRMWVGACAHLKKKRKKTERGAWPCIFMSPQHIWLLLQPLWPVCGSAPSQPPSLLCGRAEKWLSAAAVPRTPGNMAVPSFAPGWRWPPADQFVISFHLCLQSDVDFFFFFKEDDWGQWRPHPDVYVILRICLQKHWFMHYFCLLSMLTISTITVGHNTGRFFHKIAIIVLTWSGVHLINDLI